METQDMKKRLIIEQFRNRVEHQLPDHMKNEFDIVKWLKARNFDIDQAESMLLKHLEWRKQWQVDDILSWTPPEVLQKHYAVGITGVDRERAPVWIIPFGYADMKGLLHSCQKRDFIRYTIQVVERSIQMMKETAKESDFPMRGHAFIFDLKNFVIKSVTWKPAMSVVMDIIQMNEANYPELLKFAIALNAPKIFTATYALIKPFLREETQKKIQIFGSSGWKEAILKRVSHDQLPQHWGGSLTDPDGDPMCKLKVCIGGTVPKTFYVKDKMSFIPKDQLQTMVLPQGANRCIEVQVREAGTELSWELHSELFDIEFGIVRSSPGEGQEVVLPPQRVNCHMVPEQGALRCPKPGIYKLTFDNKYSYLRPKTIYYHVELTTDSQTKL